MRILLLEDHPALRAMVGDHLTRRGFAVDAVGRGEDALAALAAVAYDALVLDLGLPDLDGTEILAALRARGAGGLPILMLTARGAVPERVAGLDAGADDYLVKPFALEELDARLRGRAGAGRVVDGTPLDLPRREAALLEELLRAAGRVVVKDLLEERLYGADEPVTPNALEATASRLRRRLAEAGAGVRVETKRGIGYRLVAEEA